MSEKKASDEASKHPRKPYTQPRLVEYGPVEKLTHSGTGGPGDGGPTMKP